ncbi:hypothetical protein MKX03_030713 [Papaver bracteatum]|nr:hypothetical protein MKX03_030713 [Papaver bracteatum]
MLSCCLFVCLVTMQAQKEAPQDMQCKDRFLLRSFYKESGKVVDEFFMRGIYVPVNPMVLEVSSSRASDVENGIQRTSLFEVISKSLLMSTSSGDLLSIQPTEIKFPFELRKQISCSLQLTNKTDEYAAFKVKTTNSKKYCVRPNTGIVLPGTTCDVTEAPQDMQCKEKFLIQSVSAPIGARGKDVTPEMVNILGFIGWVIKEFKLRVIYAPENVPEGSEEGSSPSASGVDNGNQGTYLLAAVSDSLLMLYYHFGI